MRLTKILSFVIMLFIIMSFYLHKKHVYQAKGELLGKELTVNVDNEFAKILIEEPYHPDVKQFYSKYDSMNLTTETFAKISESYSIDVSSIYFIKRTFNNAQLIYNSYVSKLDSGYKAINPNTFRDVTILFVPGLGYKEDSTTGADFMRQRRILDSLGVANELIETSEWGMLEVNAKIVAEHIRNHLKKNILLVSASKGSLETKLALTNELDSSDLSRIKAWVSVGGILKGSPIADRYLSAPMCWFAQLALYSRPANIEIIKDLSYVEWNVRTTNHNVINQIPIIHYVAVPLSSTIEKRIRSRYNYLKKYGPNDGLTPLSDELMPGGIVISEIGLDHYFKDDNIDKKTISLALTALKIAKE